MIQFKVRVLSQQIEVVFSLYSPIGLASGLREKENADSLASYLIKSLVSILIRNGH